MSDDLTEAEHAENVHIAAYVEARAGYEHHTKCMCPSCALVKRSGGGWCRYCREPIDEHKLVGETAPVCRAGGGMR